MYVQKAILHNKPKHHILIVSLYVDTLEDDKEMAETSVID
jgi:hypothetical protein